MGNGTWVVWEIACGLTPHWALALRWPRPAKTLFPLHPRSGNGGYPGRFNLEVQHVLQQLTEAFDYPTIPRILEEAENAKAMRAADHPR